MPERTRRKLVVMREEDTLIFVERDGHEQRVALTIDELREKLSSFGLVLVAAEAKA